MAQFLQFVFLGLSAGAVYAVLASSLVAVHMATGVVNFAQGSTALWAVWTVAALRTDGTLVLPVGSVSLGPEPLAAAPSVAIGVATAVAWALLAHLLMFRPLRRAPSLAQVVASVGLMIFLQALVTLRFDITISMAQPILPASDVTLAGAHVDVSDLILAGTAIVIAVALWAYFRFTRPGIATRAAAEDERAARLTGLAPDRLAAVVWALTGALSGLVAVLAAPTVGLDPTTYTFYVVPALAAALLGRLVSVGLACAAGLVLGSFQSVILWGSSKTWWPGWAQAGLGDAVPFVVVIVALFLLGGRIPARGDAAETRLPAVTIPRPRLVPAALLIGAATAATLLTSGIWRFAVVTSAILALLALSQVLLTGYLGQISLATMAFAGTAGFALSKLTVSAHVPFPLSILLAALLATALGVVVGIPALRVRGAQLAVVTLAAGIAVQSFVFSNPALTPFEGNRIRDPSLFGWSLAVRSGTTLTTARFALTVLVIVTILTLAVARLMSGRTGQGFLAVRSNERAAAAAGINVAATKLLGFGLSAFLGGTGGCLIGYSRGQLSDGSFTVLAGLTLLAMAYVGGITSVGGAVVAGLIGPLGVLHTFLTRTLDVGDYYQLIAAGGLLLTVVLNPRGIAGATGGQLRVVLARYRPGRRGRAPSGPPPPVEAADVATTPEPSHAN
ncbi:ABC transporter permease [Pseudofrankia asymbiotica]|uniref:ABC transporter permease n=1 Tax=Pseudofrankia asymbiotica TaxID=1834516 RepID=A0A1V2HZM9_9ACTN|nr:ABC transporter permease [Pseudofrankia asymbiotica]ONH22228.1 ABC transporter permease [Pseudofrankia asymbiotica]